MDKLVEQAKELTGLYGQGEYRRLLSEGEYRELRAVSDFLNALTYSAVCPGCGGEGCDTCQGPTERDPNDCPFCGKDNCGYFHGQDCPEEMQLYDAIRAHDEKHNYGMGVEPPVQRTETLWSIDENGRTQLHDVPYDVPF